jgi:prephenate dehydrogenase
MTRVAELNSRMWTELFMCNRDNLAEELDLLIGELAKYRDALKADDSDTLEHLLLEGTERKRSL